MAIQIGSSQNFQRHDIVVSQIPAQSIAATERRDTGKFLQTSARARLLEEGPQALSNVELLSLVLRTSGHTSAHDSSAKLLADYGSLRTLIRADRSAARTRGLTTSGYATLQAALELARRHYQELMMTGPALSTPGATREFLHVQLRDRPYEVFAAVYLDHRNRVIHYQELFRGTIDRASVHPREVVREALSHNAAAVIVAHNHPSGVAEPSQADELITRLIKEALALLEIRLIDHLIVGDGCVASFAERGLL